MADKQTGKDTIIGPETIVSGEVTGDEDLVVRGRINGRIRLTQSLTIEAGGVVQADVDVRTLVISGVLLGNATASESVRLTDKARVIGDLNAPRIVVDAGAAYRGRIEMGAVDAARSVGKRERATSLASATAALASASSKQVPRLSTPARAAEISASSAAAPKIASPAHAAAAGARVAQGLAPRVVSSPPRVASAAVGRAGTPPSMPRPGASTGSASAPGWANKKSVRRK